MACLLDICYQIIEVYELQRDNSSSSSRSSKVADVDVDTVKREVDRLHACPSSEAVSNVAVIGSLSRDEKLMKRETTDETRKQKQPTETRTYSVSNSDNKSHKNSVRDQQEDDGMIEDEDQWDAPPTFRQPSVQVSVYGNGVRGATTSSSAATDTPTSLSAQPTPEFLPPPTPEFLPPPTPEYLPPPPSSVTDEDRFIAPAPTPDFLPPPDSPADSSSSLTFPSFSEMSSTSDEMSSSRGKVRYSADDREEGMYGRPPHVSSRDPWGSGADAVSPKRARLQWMKIYKVIEKTN
jgi:hypothetical protein